jgi:hypothetical protein
MADLNTEKILATDFCTGSEHDFQLFKNSHCPISQETCLLADSGYQGLLALHPNTCQEKQASSVEAGTKSQQSSFITKTYPD